VNILLVDDEPPVRRSMARAIARAFGDRHRVDEAEDGEEALDMLERRPYDLVVTDIRMPAVDGMTLSKTIAERYPDTIVVLLTGYADFQYAREAIRLHVYDYLLKPVSVDILCELVEKIDREKAERRRRAEIERLRLNDLLEKRVRDLFYELPIPYCDTALFPPFKTIAVLAFALPADARKDRFVRFAARNIVADVLSAWGTPVVVAEDLRLIAVLFVSGETVPPPEQMAAEAVRALKAYQRIDAGATAVGMVERLEDIRDAVRRCLEQLGDRHDPPEAALPDDAVHRLVRQAQAIIRAEYASDLTLTQLAERLYVHPNYLSTLFRRETGVTFSQYLTQVRIENAKKLLRETELKIYQICDRVGYTDQAHFSRVFKAMTGLSPYEYREQHAHSHTACDEPSDSAAGRKTDTPDKQPPDAHS